MHNEMATDYGRAPDGIGARNTAGQPNLPMARIHYFDWLRAIAVLGVVVYHSFLPFAGPWLISNAETSELLHVAALLFETFGLAVFFLLAGAGVRFALQHRSPRAFLAERARRLLVPYVAGSIVLIPPIYYIIGLYSGSLSISYPEFIVAYPVILWTISIGKLGLSPQVFIWISMHLWFLAWLFICSALALPIFALLTSSIGRSWVDALARLSRWPGATLVWAVPIALPRFWLAALNPGETAWGLDVFAWYAEAFVLGYLFYADHRFVAAIRRDLKLTLIVAVLGSCALLATGYVQWAGVQKTYDATCLFMSSLVTITGWAWTLTVLGWGMRAGFMQWPVPANLGEAAMPVYVLHYPILFGIVALVVQWPLVLAAKIIISEVLVVGATLLMAAAVLRISVLRPLLGLRHSQSGTNPATGGRLEPVASAG
jgi:peptidoglycan/LPS O-acetylase OafA/YrhL